MILGLYFNYWNESQTFHHKKQNKQWYILLFRSLNPKELGLWDQIPNIFDIAEIIIFNFSLVKLAFSELSWSDSVLNNFTKFQLIHSSWDIDYYCLREKCMWTKFILTVFYATANHVPTYRWLRQKICKCQKFGCYVIIYWKMEDQGKLIYPIKILLRFQRTLI